jgi:anti-anti-sigma factor
MSHALVSQASVAGTVDAPSPPFACSWTTGGLDAGWVHVAGALDIETAPQLERALREPQLQTHLVVLDMGELSFMDCSGVHAIVDASVRARKSGRRLVLLRGCPTVDRMFALTGSSGDVEILPGGPPV